MIAQYPLIPANAFLYFPQCDQIQQVRNQRKQRIIFSGSIPYDSEEVQRIQSFQKYMKKASKNSFILDFPDDILLRFLQATSFHHENCMKALVQYHNWQLKTLPLQISTKIQTFLKQGILYISGRDCCYKPIIVVNVGKVLRLKLKENELKDVLGFFFQYVIENCLIQGQIQSWISIIDLNYESIFSLGGALMDIISFLSSTFRVRSSHSYLLKCPSSMKLLWGMVKKVLNEDQIRKLTFTEKSQFKSEYFETINRTQIEQKYGGKLENIASFWPIIDNPNPVQTQVKVDLVSQDQYNEIFIEGKLKSRKIKKSLVKEYKESMEESGREEEEKNTEKEDSDSQPQEHVEFPFEKDPLQIEEDLPVSLTFWQANK